MSTEPINDDDGSFLEEIVDAAMEGFGHLVPPEVAELNRDTIRDRLLFHPEGRRLMRQARRELENNSRTVDRHRKPAASDAPALALVVGSSNGNADARHAPDSIRKRPL